MLTALNIVLLVIFVICSVLLTLVVLMQRPRSEGLGAAFGGGMTDSLFGAGTTDVLTKITIWFAGLFFACTLALALLNAKINSASDIANKLKARAAAEQTTEQPAAEAETPAKAN
ncbi:MAG: preprotein translocase subunit SecG [Verrucomicrobiales bacterium]|jgi:preprotein translocase subunit SecG|nr:preprotein translocase subunit SecG [Verrucomicrobiales bacterium]